MATNKAERLSGDTRVTLAWNDHTQQWRCDVSCRDGRKTIYVGRAPADRNGVDSREAYDSAARAAVAFAVDKGLECQPDYDDSEIVWAARYNAVAEATDGKVHTPPYVLMPYNPGQRRDPRTGRFYEMADAEASLSLIDRAKPHAAGIAVVGVGIAVLTVAGYYIFKSPPATAPAAGPAQAPSPAPQQAPAPRVPTPAQVAPHAFSPPSLPRVPSTWTTPAPVASAPVPSTPTPRVPTPAEANPGAFAAASSSATGGGGGAGQTSSEAGGGSGSASGGGTGVPQDAGSLAASQEPSVLDKVVSFFT